MDINKLVEVINSGGLAIVPTDTVYGIIADATNEKAIKKVYEAKRRDYSKPLIIMVSSIEMLYKYVDGVSELEKRIINKYWPGKLSILFKKSNILPSCINSKGDSIAIRYPDNKELIELMNILDKPLVSTSANLAGEETITSVDKINFELLEYIDYIYDDGFKENVPSTIIRVNNDNIEFLRKGDLSLMIERDFK
ncbi:MAG: L-threonylcarbamoyladenylate synthase [Candidatus Coprovivens sp.]